MRTRIRPSARLAVAAVALALVAACAAATARPATPRQRHRHAGRPGTTGAVPAPTRRPPAAAQASSWPSTRGPVPAVNANVAKVVLESKLGTPTTLVALDENAAWVGLDAGDLDANLEIWPSGHAADYKTYITDKKSVVDLGLLGPQAKIGWYVPSFVIDQHPELATWEGFKDPALAKLFATAETGDQGQFLMGDPSYVTYDEQIIKNLNLPLKFVVAGSEAALITAIQQAETDQKPLLLQFWQPHWLQSKVKLTEVKLPEVTDACLASAAGRRWQVRLRLRAGSALQGGQRRSRGQEQGGLRLPLEVPTDHRSAERDRGHDRRRRPDPDAAAKTWVDANPDVVTAWLG